MMAMLVTLLGVTLSQDAQAFYNSSTGRWLNRDPNGERGGKNLYSYALNRPTAKFDLDGRMTMREIVTQLLVPPTSGDYAGEIGLTWFESFNPKATIYKSLDTPCCWKILLPGYADLYMWWVKGTPGPFGTGSVTDHEIQHVRAHRDTFRLFNYEASGYTGTCYSKPKAICFAGVINDQMVTAWLAHNRTENYWIDWYYRYAEIPQAKQRETEAFQKLTSSLEVCARLE